MQRKYLCWPWNTFKVLASCMKGLSRKIDPTSCIKCSMKAWKTTTANQIKSCQSEAKQHISSNSMCLRCTILEWSMTQNVKTGIVAKCPKNAMRKRKISRHGKESKRTAMRCLYLQVIHKFFRHGSRGQWTRVPKVVGQIGSRLALR